MSTTAISFFDDFKKTSYGGLLVVVIISMNYPLFFVTNTKSTSNTPTKLNERRARERREREREREKERKKVRGDMIKNHHKKKDSSL